MFNFIDFLHERDDNLYMNFFDIIIERSESEIENIQPKDGHWKKIQSGFGEYVFNVEGDDCVIYGVKNDPCYKVTISGNDNDHNYGVSIAFTRGSSYSDYRGEFGSKVFDGVHKAIYEYIKQNKPIALNWSPISRTSVNPVTGAITNPEARSKAYEIWSIKSLFPEKYVSFKPNLWISRELYDKFYVPQGFPAVPKDLTSESTPGNKNKFLKKMREEHNNPENRQARVRASDAVDQYRATREREEAERQRQEEQRRLDQMISDPNHNPNNLAVGSNVYLDIDENNYRTKSLNSNFYTSYELRNHKNYFEDYNSDKCKILNFKIKKFDDKFFLVSTIKFAANLNDNYEFDVLVGDLKKYSSEHEEEFKLKAKEELQKFIDDARYNPNNFKVGSKVIMQQHAMAGFVQPLLGAVGTIEKISFDYDRDYLYADIIWNSDESLTDIARRTISQFPKATKMNISQGRLLLATPQNIEKLKNDIEQKDQQLQVRRQEEEERRRRQEEEEKRRREEEERFQQRSATRAERGAQIDTLGFSVGQQVTVTAGPHAGKSGQIREFRRMETTSGSPSTVAIIISNNTPFIVNTRLLRAN